MSWILINQNILTADCKNENENKMIFFLSHYVMLHVPLESKNIGFHFTYLLYLNVFLNEIVKWQHYQIYAKKVHSSETIVEFIFTSDKAVHVFFYLLTYQFILLRTALIFIDRSKKTIITVYFPIIQKIT